jgi:carbon-monoxide dehydrogenase small subunit
MQKKMLTLMINGKPHETVIEPHQTLMEILRDKLDLTGTKNGCGMGDCGACTVLIDGKTVLACLTLAVAVKDKNIETIEGLAKNNTLHPIQQAFVNHGAIQCGSCTPGMIMTTKCLLSKNPNPTREEAREALSGNLCRCTGYVKIVDAVMGAAEKMGNKS